MQNDVIKDAKALGTNADTNNKRWFAISALDLNSASLMAFRKLKQNEKKLSLFTSSSFVLTIQPRANGRNIIGCYMLGPFAHPVASML